MIRYLRGEKRCFMKAVYLVLATALTGSAAAPAYGFNLLEAIRNKRQPKEVASAQGRGEPSVIPQRSPAGETTAGAAGFDSWVKKAIGGAGNLSRMPKGIKNRYGHSITPEDVIRTIIWIESKGYHTRGGRPLVNSRGFTGFMQLGQHFGNAKYDPAKNIALGTKYFNDKCLRSATSGGNKLFTYNGTDSREDRLVKGITNFNRGPYATTGKLREKGLLQGGMVGLDRPWDEVIARTPSTGHNYLQEGVDYGLQGKAALGLPLTPAEKGWIKSYRGLNSNEAFDAWERNIYGSVRGM